MSVLRQANSFLGGEQFTFDEIDRIWKELRDAGDVSTARAVLRRVRQGGHLSDGLPASRAGRQELCRQHAMLTSKDEEIVASQRHNMALGILEDEFDLRSLDLDGDGETLGIAGGILKRRWDQLGSLEDLIAAAELYRRGVGDIQHNLTDDQAYAAINAAYLDDVLASLGHQPDERASMAHQIRTQVIGREPERRDWWSTATTAEAHFGLGDYTSAKATIKAFSNHPEPWKLETTARQLAAIAHLREEDPTAHTEIRSFFEELLAGSAHAVHSTLVGKTGLALSGGGFRASFYHLGVLAYLAEVDALRNVEVLSCVSGGSIIGASYWLELRRRVAQSPGKPIDYVDLVQTLIEHFENAVATDLRGQAQVGKTKALWRLTQGERGVMDSDDVAAALEEHFFRPLMPGEGPLYMHELQLQPGDHNEELVGPGPFNPAKHNWLRYDKIPALVINATTVNTGHAWHFTPTWMGESPWAIHQPADSVPRLQWEWYQPDAGWATSLATAVAASACVPGLFSPVLLEGLYDDIDVQLVDGGVYDNQGTTALLANSCNVILVSDAAGQLKLEHRPGDGVSGLFGYAKRSMDTLMERIRQANFGDLSNRDRSGQIRALMFLHMKAGLNAEPIRLPFASQAFETSHSTLTPSGIRRDFQQALSELRTDLNIFSYDESRSLMACGYQMARKFTLTALAQAPGLVGESNTEPDWVFAQHLAEITSTAASTPHRSSLLKALQDGAKIEP